MYRRNVREDLNAMAKKGRSIFTSYKYGDRNVYGRGQTVRDYVDELQELLEEDEHVNKGEPDGVDLSKLEDDAIRQILANRMFYSSVTIVVISPNMVEKNELEREQWIPWEASYSLQTKTRQDGKSYPNAMIAVAVPDANDSYKYYIEENFCPFCKTRRLWTNILFPILKGNMFNAYDKEEVYCDDSQHGAVYRGEHSYIDSVKWDDFMENSERYIARAIARQQNRRAYKINTNLTG